MYLKRLELQGFKSFAQKTVFEFDAGITAIVGPNGSGKSNVADALRWVLGEQSLKSLRAKDGEDFIFSGGKSRTRAGTAEVALTFDNSTGWLPIDFSEVSVGRRTYRSGENEYLLNGSRVRRRDLVELLAKGGMTANSYTVIAQGLVDMALTMDPLERRKLFEEAAGISIYKAKRDQAVDKLLETTDNLRRVQDILQEISPRLASLSRLAQRAERQQALAAELEQLLDTWHGYQWHTTQSAAEEAESRVRALREELDQRRANLQNLRRQAEEAWAREAILRQRSTDWERERSLLQDGYQTAQRSAAVAEERVRLLGEKRGEIRKDLLPLHESRQETERRLQEARTRLQVLEQEERSYALTGYEGMRPQEESMAQIQAEAFQKAARAATLRNRQVQLQDRERALQAEMVEEEKAIVELEGEIVHGSEEQARIEDQISALKKENGLLAEQEKEQSAAHTVALRRSEDLRSRLAGIEKSLAQREAQMGHQQVDALVALQQSAGVLGILSQLLRFPDELAPVLRSTLGPLLGALVLESWEAAVQLLQEERSTPLILIPLDALVTSPAASAPQEPGVLGPASQMVECEERLRGLAEALLGSTLIVEDLETARKLQHRGLRLVTKHGEVLDPTGILYVGAYYRERNVAQEIAAGKQEREEIEVALSRLQEEMERLRDEALRIQAQRWEKEASLRQAQDEKAHLFADWGRMEKELEWRKSILARKQEELASLSREKTEMLQTLEEATRQEEAFLAQLEALQNQVQAPREASRAVLLERIDRAQALVQSLEDEQSKLAAQAQQKGDRLADLSREEETLTGEWESAQSQAQELSRSLTALDEQMASAREELAQIWEARRAQDIQESQERQELYEVESHYSQALAEWEKWRERLASIQTQIEGDLESVTLSSPLATQLPLDMGERLRRLPQVSEVPEGLEKRIKSLKRTLHQIGGVDTGILEEYQSLKERHEFLVTQSQDLKSAEKDLRKLISDLDRLIEERFLTTFQRVAQEFESAFTVLFGGGKGRLFLSDPQNPAETGVEIQVQPPGKRRQSLATLSGGERALTGVGLVFALLKTAETPFCLLDEVDATLDEANIRRFRQALEEIAQRTQVVIITHNRGTMEAAQTIYGVTMEDSISRVLSLRLEEVPVQ